MYKAIRRPWRQELRIFFTFLYYNFFGEVAKIKTINRPSCLVDNLNLKRSHEGCKLHKFVNPIFYAFREIVIQAFTHNNILIRHLHKRQPFATLKAMMRHGKILRPKDVAEMLGITPGGVRMMVYRGQLPARKLGRRIVFLEDELREALKKLPRVVPERI